MAASKHKYRTIYIVTAALMVALVGGYALAAGTVVNTGPNQQSTVTTVSTNGFLYGTLSSDQLVIITPGMNGAGTAGTPTPLAVGLAGTPAALTTCTVAPCTVANYRANIATTGVTPAVGDYGEQIVLAITQPVTATGSQDSTSRSP